MGPTEAASADVPWVYRNSNVPFVIMQNPARSQSDLLLNDKTVDIQINGESVLPGGLTVVTADNYSSMKETMRSGRSLVLIDPDAPEWVRTALPSTPLQSRLDQRRHGSWYRVFV